MWSSRWASSSPRGVLPGFVAANVKGSTGDVADPQRAHELQPRQPVQLVGMPLMKIGVLRCLADDGILDDRIAEVIDHRCDGEHATQSFVQARLSHACPLPSFRVPCGHVSRRSTGGTWMRFSSRTTRLLDVPGNGGPGGARGHGGPRAVKGQRQVKRLMGSKSSPRTALVVVRPPDVDEIRRR